jgi:hypothetical protein
VAAAAVVIFAAVLSAEISVDARFQIEQSPRQ